MAEEWLKDLVETEARKLAPVSVTLLLARIGEDPDAVSDAIGELRAEQVLVLDDEGRLDLAGREASTRPLRAVPESPGESPSGDDELPGELTDGAQTEPEGEDSEAERASDGGFGLYRAELRLTLEWEANLDDEAARAESMELLRLLSWQADDHGAAVVTARVERLSEASPRVIW